MIGKNLAAVTAAVVVLAASLPACTQGENCEELLKSGTDHGVFGDTLESPEVKYVNLFIKACTLTASFKIGGTKMEEATVYLHDVTQVTPQDHGGHIICAGTRTAKFSWEK